MPGDRNSNDVPKKGVKMAENRAPKGNVLWNKTTLQ